MEGYFVKKKQKQKQKNTKLNETMTVKHEAYLMLKHSNDWQVNSRSSFKSVYRQVKPRVLWYFPLNTASTTKQNEDPLKTFCCQMCRI